MGESNVICFFSQHMHLLWDFSLCQVSLVPRPQPGLLLSQTLPPKDTQLLLYCYSLGCFTNLCSFLAWISLVLPIFYIKFLVFEILCVCHRTTWWSLRCHHLGTAHGGSDKATPTFQRWHWGVKWNGKYGWRRPKRMSWGQTGQDVVAGSVQRLENSTSVKAPLSRLQ